MIHEHHQLLTRLSDVGSMSMESTSTYSLFERRTSSASVLAHKSLLIKRVGTDLLASVFLMLTDLLSKRVSKERLAEFYYFRRRNLKHHTGHFVFKLLVAMI